MKRDELVEVLQSVFESPNESDSNGEYANVVDGLFFIGRAIEHLAVAVEGASKNGMPPWWHK